MRLLVQIPKGVTGIVQNEWETAQSAHKTYTQTGITPRNARQMRLASYEVTYRSDFHILQHLLHVDDA